MAAELGDKFSLDDALLYGLLPLRFGSVDPGVYRALRPFSIHDARTELEGIALEGWLQNIYKLGKTILKESILFIFGEQSLGSRLILLF